MEATCVFSFHHILVLMHTQACVFCMCVFIPSHPCLDAHTGMCVLHVFFHSITSLSWYTLRVTALPRCHWDIFHYILIVMHSHRATVLLKWHPRVHFLYILIVMHLHRATTLLTLFALTQATVRLKWHQHVRFLYILIVMHLHRASASKMAPTCVLPQFFHFSIVIHLHYDALITVMHSQGHCATTFLYIFSYCNSLTLWRIHRCGALTGPLCYQDTTNMCVSISSSLQRTYHIH